MAKAYVLENMVINNPDSDNAHARLPYTVQNGVVDFDSDNLIFALTADRVMFVENVGGPNTWQFPAVAINTDLVNSTLRTNGIIQSDNTGFFEQSNANLVDNTSPRITLSGATGLDGIITQFYDMTGGSLVSSVPFHTVNDNGSFSRGPAVPGFTQAVTRIRIVSYGTGWNARVTDLDVGSDNISIDLSTLVPTVYPSQALSTAGIIFDSEAAATDSDSDAVYVQSVTVDSDLMRMTVAVDANRPSPILTDTLTNDWLQKAVRSTTEYGRIVALTGSDFITSAGSSAFAIASSDRIRFTPGNVTNSSHTFGHINNTVQGQLPIAFSVPRTVDIVGGGTATLTVDIETTAATFDSISIDVAIANAGLASQQDVLGARNIILATI